MSAIMLAATLAAPAHRAEPLDFDAGRRALAEITDPSIFTFQDFWATAENTLDDLDPDVDPIDENDHPVLELAHRVCGNFIDALEEIFTGEEPSEEIDYCDIAGYRLYITGGLSWGGAPSDATQVFWDAQELPESVLHAIGFVTDTSTPLPQNADTSGKTTGSEAGTE